jgi:hypothetical protein
MYMNNMREFLLTQISLNQIHDQIKELESLDRQSITIDELKHKISRLMKGHTVRPRKIVAKNIFRARKTPQNRLFNKVNELWYPPTHLTTRYGRCNNINTTIFYCSDRESTAILELRPDIGDYLTILKCRLKDSNNLPYVQELGLPEFTAKYNPQLGGTILENSALGKAYWQNQENEVKNLAIRSFLVKEFIQNVVAGNEDQYKISVAISEILMSNDAFDGICYPSIATQHQGTNLALKPTSADRLYQPSDCWVILVEEEIAPLDYEVRRINKTRSIKPNGVIEW